MAPVASPATWKLAIEVNGSAKSWIVCPSKEEARAAAGLQSGGPPQDVEQDGQSGFSHFKVTEIREGTVSLDDIDIHVQDHFFTWPEELRKVNLGALATNTTDVLIKARAGEDGKLVWELPEHLQVKEQKVKSVKAKASPKKKSAEEAKKKSRRSQEGPRRSTSQSLVGQGLQSPRPQGWSRKLPLLGRKRGLSELQRNAGLLEA